MANQRHLALLEQGRDHWNDWRDNHPRAKPNLSGALLFGADLVGFDLRRADLSGAHLNRTFLSTADLREANLVGAQLVMAYLMQTDLRGANLDGANLTSAFLVGALLDDASVHAYLTGANLKGAGLRGADLEYADLDDANLSGADLTKAVLRRANLSRAILVGANLKGADLTGCTVYGVSAWDLKVDRRTKQVDLAISPNDQAGVTVDNIEIASFLYLLLNNPRVRHAIDAISTKVVLILGRFTPERKRVLDILRQKFRQRDYVPILVDFSRPASRDLTETVSTLAHLARFIVADLTDAQSIPQELQAVVPMLPSVPVQPLLQASAHEYGMFEHFRRYPWVLPVYRYVDVDDLVAALAENIIAPAERKAGEFTTGAGTPLPG